MPESADHAAALFDNLLICYSAHSADESHPFPGVIEALNVLRTAGAKLVVCANKPTALSHSLLAKSGMADLFDGIAGIDAVTEAKPDTAHLIEAAQAVESDLARTIMVGDVDRDAGTARAAGTS